MKLIASGSTRFSIKDANFVIDTSWGPNRRPSTAEEFTIVKTPEYLNHYIRLSNGFHPRTIFELGIFQGGGFVFFDKLFEPEAISAVDISDNPVSALVDYTSKVPGRHAHFGTDQTDSKKLLNIVHEELGGTVDLIIDDASHLYEQTKSSFDILFPHLAPGGYYVIEDWAWAHRPLYQGPSAPCSTKKALTNLIFELTQLLASTGLVTELSITRPMCIIRKAMATKKTPDSIWEGVLSRGKQLNHI